MNYMYLYVCYYRKPATFDAMIRGAIIKHVNFVLHWLLALIGRLMTCGWWLQILVTSRMIYLLPIIFFSFLS